MSRYQDIRFKGIVKKEFRETFEPIALEGKWFESEDKILREFGEDWAARRIPNANSIYMIDRWEKDPWIASYDKETGEWQFQVSINVYSFPIFDWEYEIIPYIMESVKHYEVWTEPIGDDPYHKSTTLFVFEDGMYSVAGWFDEEGNYTPRVNRF